MHDACVCLGEQNQFSLAGFKKKREILKATYGAYFKKIGNTLRSGASVLSSQVQLSNAEYTWFYPDLRVSSRHFSNFILFQTPLVPSHNKVLEMFSVETDFGCPSSISSARDASRRFHSVTLFFIVEQTLHKLLPTLIIL